ncbi:MAG: 3'-5' exonuclease [Clostridium perfringens]|nr:3'-5' exonuclease [Clostridium perfringens]
MIKINYVVFDLEFNQSSEDKDHRLLNFEIIQIGAVKLDDNFNIIDKFNKLVKPSVNLNLHPYVKDLLNIDEDLLKISNTFPFVFNDFIKLLDKDTVFVVWGKDDIKILLKNANFHKLSTSNLPTLYIDIQSYGNRYFGLKKGLKIGLKKAVELLEIENTNEFHDAYYDALCTAKVFKRLYTSAIKPIIYTPNNVRGEKQEKKIIDMESLIKQIEKIFKRPMTKEEMEIIRLSYMMGKTNQFTKYLSPKIK